MRKDGLLVALQELKDQKEEHIDMMSVQYADWLKELRGIKEHLENPLATDYQMEMVRRKVDGLIATHLTAYKQLMK
jgi:hypothetical protein